MRNMNYNIIPVVAVYIIHNNKLLLVQEIKPEKKNIIKVPTGRIEYGEYAFEAAYREVNEETNLKIKNLDLFSIMRYKGYKGDMLLRYSYYAVQTDSDLGKIKPRKNEIKDIYWIRIDEYIKEMRIKYPYPHHNHLLANILERRVKKTL